MHKIENTHLRVSAREYGAELISIYNKASNIEHLWQADKTIWGWHSPVLFPVVGRCLNDQVTIDGTTYPMNKHGFGRRSEFKLLELSDTKMVFSLVSSADTLKSYPYRFEFLVSYRLNANTLTVAYEVVNEDVKELYFSLGGHPAFNAPFLPGEKYEDYFIEFERKENSARHFIDINGYFDGRKEVILNNSNRLQLKDDLFKDDALIFKDLKSRKATLKSNKNNHYLSVDFTGFSYLGLWAKTNAPYVCIEPWLGCADTANHPTGFKDKEGIIKLEGAGEFAASFKVEVG